MSFPSSSAVRAVAVPVLLLLLILAMALSLLVGAKPLPASVIVDALFGTCQSADCTIVLDARLPVPWPDYLPVAHWGLREPLCKPSPATRWPTPAFLA